MEINRVAKQRFNLLVASLPYSSSQTFRRYPYLTYSLRTQKGHRSDVKLEIVKVKGLGINPHSYEHDIPSSFIYESLELNASECTPRELIEKAVELEGKANALTLDSVEKWRILNQERNYQRERRREEQKLAEQTARVIKEKLNSN